MAKDWKFLSKEQHGYGENVFGSIDEFFDFSKKKYTEKASDSTIKISNQPGISLGGILTNKVSGTSVNLGIRLRLDKGFGRTKEIIEEIKKIKERLDDNGIKDFLRNYIEPDIRANIYTIFKTGGINAYGDGIDWPDNSRLWKKFKEKHLNEENVLNPFFGVNSNIQFFPKVMHDSVGQLTGTLRYALTADDPEDEYKLKFHITGSNLYVGSSLPYLSNFQKDRPVLFIGENQKRAWLEMFKKYALLNPSEITNLPKSKMKNELLSNILNSKEGIKAFDTLNKLSSVGKNFKSKVEESKRVIKEEKVDIDDLAIKNKQQVEGFSKYLKTKAKNKKKGM